MLQNKAFIFWCARVTMNERWASHGLTKFEDSDFENILINEKSHKSIWIFDISYETLICPKPLTIKFDEIDGFIRTYHGTRYLVLLGPEK